MEILKATRLCSLATAALYHCECPEDTCYCPPDVLKYTAEHSLACSCGVFSKYWTAMADHIGVRTSKVEAKVCELMEQRRKGLKVRERW